MQEYRDKTNTKQQKCEILICFWFAIDRCNVPAAQYLYESDNMVNKLLANIRRNGKFYIDIKRNLEKAKAKKAVSHMGDDEEMKDSEDNLGIDINAVQRN
jgi:hypothetical protein